MGLRSGLPRVATVGVVLLLTAVAFQIVPLPVVAAGAIDPYLSGLNVPIALGFASDGRIFFNERNTGSIRIIENGSLLPTPFITLPNTDTSGERGLLGLALDPAFPSTPYVYAYQTYIDAANSSTYNRIVRISANGNIGVSYIVILRMPPLSGATNHNGGVIAFGPDGKLYAVVGENANPALAQDKMSPMGKVLRMNTDVSAPPDNPYHSDLTWNPLVYTYGHRNMFGLAFHPTTGHPYVTENGPACNDEVNLLPDLIASNRNFGWGPSNTCSTPPPPPNNTNRDGPNPILPIFWWNATTCPTNAAIYGGPYFPAYRGDLFMGDCNYRRFHRIHLAPPNYDVAGPDTIVWTAPDIILDVEQGLDGAIWITTQSTICRYHDTSLPPQPAFTFAPSLPVVNQTVAFDGSASYSPNRTIVSYSWRFGDSSIGSGRLANHTYSAFGLYNVTLTVVDNESYFASITHQVRVLSRPVASFTVTPPTPIYGELVTFDAASSHDPDGVVVRYDWTLGDGAIGAGVNTTHRFATFGSYKVNLTVTDNDGLTANATKTVIVGKPNQQPSASFTQNASPVNPGVAVTFNGSASTDPDGNITMFAWVFGDGTTANGISLSVVSHSYAVPGNYTVSLTVTDNNGTFDTAVSYVLVNAPPHAAFVSSRTQTFIGIDLAFNAASSSDPDSEIVAYTWDFGDSSSGSGRLIIHAFAHKGDFTVRLTVRDDLGLTNSTTLIAMVVNRAPIITSASPSSANVTALIGATVAFRIVAQDPDQDTLSYGWRVDGNLVSSQPSFDFVDGRAGTHHVTVSVTDGTAVESHSWDVTDVAPPPAGLEGSAVIGGILIAAGILLVALILLVSRRRRRKHGL